MFKPSSSADERQISSTLKIEEPISAQMTDSSSLIKLIGIRRLSESDGCTNEAFVQVEEESIAPRTAFSTWRSYEQTKRDEKEDIKSSRDASTSSSEKRVRAGEEERDQSGPSKATGLLKEEDAMHHVSLDSLYVPPVSHKYAYEEERRRRGRWRRQQEESEQVQQDHEERLHETRGRFRVFWRDIIYRINTFSWMKHVMNMVMKTVPQTYERTILSQISGSFESGRLTALMGPSGAGKTTLLECLIGKRVSGLSGEINIQSIDQHPLPPLQMALIPQLDSFFEKITPREAIRYASKMKNAPLPVNDDDVSQELIDRLGLTSCCDLETSRLSGSQRKRLSIACDLVSKPNVLVLDEPTTGLDAYAARKLCQLLNELASERNLAVIMTVHQPSWAIFLTFHKIYMLSPVIGRAIYEGPPDKLVQHLSAFDLHCPKQTNASDFLTEIAFGRAEKQQLIQLAHHHQMQFDRLMARSTGPSYNFSQLLHKNARSYPFLSHSCVLASRFTLTFTRDLLNILISSTLAGLLAAVYCICFTFSGQSDGCPSDLSRLGAFNNSLFTQLLVDTSIEAKEVRKNIFLVLMLLLILMMMVMTPVLVLIPQELKIYWKEVKNSYYSPGTLFISKTIFELILTVILVAYLQCIVYFATKQRFISDSNGFSGFLGIFEGLYLLALIIQSQGTVVAVLLAQSPDSVIIAGNMLIMMNLLYSGIFAPIHEMSVFCQIIGIFIPGRWISPIFLVGLYGHERCPYHSLEDNVFTIKSKVDRWLARITRSVDDESMSPFVNENLLLGQLVSDHQNALNNLTFSQCREVTKGYISIQGKQVKLFPMALVNSAIDYDDDVPARMMLITHLILARVLAYLVLLYSTKKSQ